MVKLLVLLREAMPTVGGRMTAEGLSVVSLTIPPLAGAGVTSATVPRSELPPMTPVSLAFIARSVGVPGGPGSIWISLACAPPENPYDAWIITQCAPLTCGAVIVKSPLRLPAGIVTSCGVITCPSMLPFNRMTAPPAGAGDVSRTVPVEVAPAGIAWGFNVNDEKLGGGGALPDGVSVIHACGAR